MSRFFINKSAIDTAHNRITVTGEDVKHIRSVLRATPGETLELCDGEGTDYHAVIVSMEKDSILTEIADSLQNRSEPPLSITLFQGVPKADKMDLIIQKCVELGINRIVPVLTERTVVRFENAKDAANKAARWQRIALEAAKQCNRGIIPQVTEPVKLSEALKLAESSSLKLIPYEEEKQGSLRSHLQLYRQQAGKQQIVLFIGPEGGFSNVEVEKCVNSGFHSVTLGPRILRTETAGLAVLAVVMYELGDWSAPIVDCT